MTLSYAGFYPFRCQDCGRRFTRLDWESAEIDFHSWRGQRRSSWRQNLLLACIVIVALALLLKSQ